jgi:hypothetical protein
LIVFECTIRASTLRLIDNHFVVVAIALG